ncbi:diacylglycerol kinase family protein [Sediminibacterium soli]|uniref:diacylglycerol kinase family protein n=1 Tax=Sediminibacterium soli TaxID=2698829 RepID=UPI00137B2556|nr:diacylglycerol kinase family protein [Sediminibacterium soli]NCI47529.1 diacylglycerol kinase family protein [Sediminibacterium soli]
MKQQAITRAFRHAWDGISVFFRHDRNGRIHLAAAILVLLAGWYFSVSAVEWCILCLCVALVIGLEMMNHALEKLCNMVHEEWHPVVKVIKDVSAGAVLVASVISLITGLIIFLPKLQSIL